MSTTTPATRTTRSPSTTASTAAARGQMPASWTHAAPSLNGTLLWNAARRTKEDLANTISALISLKVCNSINFSDRKLDKKHLGLWVSKNLFVLMRHLYSFYFRRLFRKKCCLPFEWHRVADQKSPGMPKQLHKVQKVCSFHMDGKWAQGQHWYL